MDSITLPRELVERVIDSLRSASSGWVPMQPLIDEIRSAIALHDLAAADRAAGLDYAQPSAEPVGFALAMRVLQSDLYPLLDDTERDECDALIAAGQRRKTDGGGR